MKISVNLIYKISRCLSVVTIVFLINPKTKDKGRLNAVSVVKGRSKSAWT